MPLRITLKPKERVFIAGAVVVNGDGKCDLVVLNDVAVLREKDILTSTSADTPCKRIYLAVQLMYMNQMNLAQCHEPYWSLVRDVVVAAPSTGDLIDQISAHVLSGRYYPALKSARTLVQYEKELIRHVRQPHQGL